MEKYSRTCRFDLKRKYPVTMKYLLTDREQLVMNLVCQGKSNHEIATELDVSVNTIKTHLQHVYKKLAVDNRTQASVRYLNIRS